MKAFVIGSKSFSGSNGIDLKVNWFRTGTPFSFFPQKPPKSTLWLRSGLLPGLHRAPQVRFPTRRVGQGGEARLRPSLCGRASRPTRFNIMGPAGQDARAAKGERIGPRIIVYWPGRNQSTRGARFMAWL